MLKIKECKKFMKTCNKCGNLKLIIHFEKRKDSKDGRRNDCKQCRKTRYEHICQYCNKKFKSEKKNTKFCSPQCNGKWKSENLIGEKSSSWKYGKIKIKCDFCEKEIYKTFSEIKKYKKHFCGKECYDKWQKENSLKGENSAVYSKVETKCDYCGKNIKVFKSRYNAVKHHFCNNECHYKWKSKNLIGSKSNFYGIHRFGKENYNYNPNLTEEDRVKHRNTLKIKEWRNKVFERDNYTCQITGDNKGGNLVSHHLNSHNWDKENRYNLDNGITITEEIHKLFHNIYGYGDNTKEQFEEFKQRYNNREFKGVS